MHDLNAAEKQQVHTKQYAASTSSGEKTPIVHEESTHDAAARGHLATDTHGRSLVHIDPKAERKLRWKIDLYVVPTVALLYLFCFIDRANIGNARLAGLEKDLHLKGNDYNILLSIFFIPYIVCEIPCNMLCKWIGPGWFIPATSLGFGIASVGMAFVTDLSNACGVRFLLGLFETGMLPGIAYYLSRWYRRSELTFRLSLYIVMAPLAGAFGGLLASAILSLDGIGTVKHWRMIFLIEGIITIGISIIAFFTLTDRPETARWLNEEEKEMAVARIKSERVGQFTVLDGIDTTKTLRGICNPTTIMVSIIFFCDCLVVQGFAVFAPSIVKTIYPHDSVISQQLHTVPPYAVGAIFTVLFPWLSWRFDRRNIFFIIGAPLMMVGYIMFLATNEHQPHVRYGATFFITSGAFAFGATCNAQISANVVSDTARASAIGLSVMMGNLGGLVSTWSFLAWDAPNYHIGNGLNLAVSSLAFIMSIVLTFYMTWDNKRREKVDVDAALAGLSEKQVEDLDWKHPGFRWKQ